MTAKKKKLPKKTEVKGVFWPVVLILVGALMLAFNLGLLPKELMKYWPVILVIIGLTGLSNGL